MTEGVGRCFSFMGKTKSSGRENKSQQKTGCWIAGVTVINAIRHCKVDDADGNGPRHCELGWAFNFEPSPSIRGAHLFFAATASEHRAECTENSICKRLAQSHRSPRPPPSPRTCPVYFLAAQFYSAEQEQEASAARLSPRSPPSLLSLRSSCSPCQLACSLWPFLRSGWVSWLRLILGPAAAADSASPPRPAAPSPTRG